MLLGQFLGTLFGQEVGGEWDVPTRTSADPKTQKFHISLRLFQFPVPDVDPYGTMYTHDSVVPPPQGRHSNFLDVILSSCVSWVNRLHQAVFRNRYEWFEAITCVDRECEILCYVFMSGGPYETETLNTTAKKIVELVEMYDASIDSRIDRAIDGNTQKNVCYRMLKVVMHPRVSEWDICRATSHVMRETMILSLSSLPNIQRLKIPGQINSGCKKLLLCNIHTLKNLQEFRFDYGCDREVLVELGKHCTRLKKLFINSSKHVGDNSIIELMKLEELVILDISETAITPKGYGAILSHLKNLENVMWSGFIDDVLMNVAKDRLCNVNTMSGSVRNTDIIITKCPLIKNFCVVKTENNVQSIGNLVAMAELNIVSCDATAINLVAILQGISTGLTSLEVGNVTNMDIEHVIMHASLLEKLTIVCCKFKQTSGSFFDSTLPHFRCLEFLEMIGNQWYGDFRSYLKSYACLKVFIAKNTPEVDDTAVKTVVESRGFQELREFSAIDCGPLGKIAACLLIKSCAKLKRIRGVRTWSGLGTKNDIAYVLGMAKSLEVPVTVEM
jgi:hypothetical protein